MNILIIGKPSVNLINLINKSRYVNKVYTTQNDTDTEFPNIQYETFNKLIQKAIALKIDIAINVDKSLIEADIVEIFKQSKINLISVNKKWLNLETSRLSTKILLNHYGIKNPKMLNMPAFPMLIKTDTTQDAYIVTSMKELVDKMEKLQNTNTFFEECIDGDEFELYAIWDSKNIKYLYNKTLLTEVKYDRLDLLRTKLHFMLSDEHADFTGIFKVNLVWYKNDWYIVGFEMNTDIPEEMFVYDKNDLKSSDFIYLLNSAIYQTLCDI